MLHNSFSSFHIYLTSIWLSIAIFKCWWFLCPFSRLFLQKQSNIFWKPVYPVSLLWLYARQQNILLQYYSKVLVHIKTGLITSKYCCDSLVCFPKTKHNWKETTKQIKAVKSVRLYLRRPTPICKSEPSTPDRMASKKMCNMALPALYVSDKNIHRPRPCLQHRLYRYFSKCACHQFTNRSRTPSAIKACYPCTSTWESIILQKELLPNAPCPLCPRKISTACLF